MVEQRSSPRRRYLVCVIWILSVTAAVLLIGYLPTRSLGGREAVKAMFAGCSVSLVASVLGGLPIALAPEGGKSGLQAILASTALRFLVVLVLALAAALSGAFEPVPLLTWMGLSYVACLVVDTRFAVAAAREV